MMPFQFSFGASSISFTSDPLRGFNGASQLPEYGLDHATVMRPRSRVRPLSRNNSDLSVDAWRLAHSVKKADCARGITAVDLNTSAMGFLIENFNLLDWSPDNLRLNNGMADFYADFSRTSLSGRVAQGMAILFMEERGYSYGGRFSTFLKSARGKVAARQLLKSKAGSVRNPKTPDFIFEQHGTAVALAESKGGFVSPNRIPDIKGDLREALQQLKGWDRLLQPQPSKSFAVGTYLRESDDFSDEPSLIAFVDPEPEEPYNPVHYPPELIRRCNYASWFAGMGFHDSAKRLQQGREGSYPIKRRLPILTLGHHRYAFVVLSVRPMFRDYVSFDERFWLDLDDLFFSPHSFHGGLRLEIMGVEMPILASLSKYLLTGKSELLMHIETIIEKDLPQKVDEGKFRGSVFSDGTLFGEIQVSSPRFGGIAFEEVEL